MQGEVYHMQILGWERRAFIIHPYILRYFHLAKYRVTYVRPWLLCLQWEENPMLLWLVRDYGKLEIIVFVKRGKMVVFLKENRE